MKNYITENGGKILYNTEIKNISYIKKKFNIYTNNSILLCDILISTISKNNILKFKFWNKEQKNILTNTTNTIEYKIINSFINNFINNDNDEGNDKDNDIKNIILYNFHIIYPNMINKQSLNIWNRGYNNDIIREKIKNIYNNKFFICNDSYSKNNIFINYSLENIDNIILSL